MHCHMQLLPSRNVLQNPTSNEMWTNAFYQISTNHVMPGEKAHSILLVMNNAKSATLISALFMQINCLIFSI